LRNAAPSIGLRAHFWDDENPQTLRGPARCADDERGWWNEIQEGTLPKNWQSEQWSNTTGWGDDQDGRQINWNGLLIPPSDSIWPNHESLWSAQNQHNFASIWDEPSLDDGWKTQPSQQLPKNDGWMIVARRLEEKIKFLETRNKRLQSQLDDGQRQHKLVEKELTTKMLDKAQQVESLGAHIVILQHELEEKEKQNLVSNVTDKLLQLSISDLEEVNLITQEILIKKKREQRESKLCVVCIDLERNSVVVPCGHFCLCEYCVEKLPQPIRCPVCRGSAREIVRVYT